MKSVIALMVLVGASSAFANSLKLKDTTDYNCYDLRKKLNLNGQLSLSTNGGKKVTYIGEWTGSCNGDNKETVFVQTADFKGCPLYTCVPKAN